LTLLRCKREDCGGRRVCGGKKWVVVESEGKKEEVDWPE